MKFEHDTKFLAVLALILMLGVYFVVVKEPPESLSKTGAGEAIAPDFKAQVESAARITLDGEGGAVTLDFDGQMWRVLERDGYPASQATVNGLLRGLSDSKKADPKTADHNYFDRLGLADRSRRITVYDSAGSSLASVLTGDQFYDPTGEGIMTFVFDEPTGRAWTATGLPQLSLAPAYWLKAEVISLSELRLKKLTVTIGETETWSISKSTPSAPAFTLDGGYVGTPPNLSLIDAAGYAITGVYLEDVLNPADLELFRVGTATYSTFDGLSVVMTFYDHDGMILTAFEAIYDPDVLLADDTPQVLMDVPPDGAAEAVALNMAWQGRIFQLPIETLAAILKRRQDLFTAPGRPVS